MRPYATSVCGLKVLVVQAREPRITVGDLMAEMGLSSLDELMDSVSLKDDIANRTLSNRTLSNSSARQERGLAKSLASATAAAWRGVDP